MKHTRSSVHRFANVENAPFTARDYSRLKFGSDKVAQAFGHALADDFFSKHADTLLARPAVVIPSPYSYVRNAATVMTGHFLNRLNEHLVHANGQHVEYDTIRRAISYVSDYGFLSHAKRKALIGKDSFYLNKGFWRDKTLIFVDDVRITGAHEDRLKQVLAVEEVRNEAFFLYYGDYTGNQPSIEAELNFAAVASLADYRAIEKEAGHHLIVRPIKYLLGKTTRDEFLDYLKTTPTARLWKLYHSALGEGYTQIPQFTRHLRLLTKHLRPETV